MPIEKTPNYIRIRVASPKKFIRFRIKRIGKGIMAVIGFMKAGGSQIQSLMFPRSKYTLKTAKAWVKSHGYSVHETYVVYDVIIDPKTYELYFEETVATDEDDNSNVDVEKMSKDEFAWLIS